MKHKKTGRKLSRTRKLRRALIKTILGSLIMAEKITTTEARAKEIRPMIDKLINKAKKIKGENKIAAIRELKKIIPQGAINKLAGDFLKKFEGKNGGYARIIKLPPRRGDSAKMAVIELIQS